MSTSMQAVRDFIHERNPQLDAIGADDDLIDSRAINSLAFVEFIFLLEELTGQAIDPESLEVDDFRTLNAIEKKFFTEEVPA